MLKMSTIEDLSTEEQNPHTEMDEFAEEQNNMLLEFNKICRLCLVGGDELFTVFERKLQAKLKKLSLEIKIEEGDELPQQVCQQCIQHINSSYYFKLQCQRSHVSLMQQLSTEKQTEKFEAEEQQQNSGILTNNSAQEMEIYTEEEVSLEEKEEEVNDTEEHNQLESDMLHSQVGNQGMSVVIGEYDEQNNQPNLEMFVTSYSHFDPKELLRRKLTLLPRVHTCDVCGRSFRTRGTLKQHRKCHQGNKIIFQCEQCNKVYPNAAKLQEHVTGVHAEKKPFSCDLCGRGFPYKSTLKMHVRVHTGEKPFKCETCGKGFGQKHNLEEHRVVHTEDRPFVCDICGMRYRQLRNLKIHKETHLGLPKTPKPIKRWCEHCGRGFNAVASFRRHLMTHTGEKPFQCEICEKRFATKAKMVEHKRIHTDERPFVCTVCNKAFKVKEVMTKHILLQHNPNPEKHYTCDTCKLTFSSMSYLRKHIRCSHFKEKYYPCPICQQVYFQRYYINLHIKNVHKMNPEVLKIEEKKAESDSEK